MTGPNPKMNDRERRMWVENDEPLYRWWKSTGIGLYRFVGQNRGEITRTILIRMGYLPDGISPIVGD